MVRQRGINPGDLREPIQKIIEPEQPHSDLVPVGLGIHVNPDKPVDPWDCERWDGSPFCGDNPWGGFAPNLDVTPVIDECNIGIQVQPQGFGVYFPEFQVVYRRPECRGSAPEEPIEKQESEKKTDFSKYSFAPTDTICACISISGYTEEQIEVYSDIGSTDPFRIKPGETSIHRTKKTATGTPEFFLTKTGGYDLVNNLASINASYSIEHFHNDVYHRRFFSNNPNTVPAKEYSFSGTSTHVFRYDSSTRNAFFLGARFTRILSVGKSFPLVYLDGATTFVSAGNIVFLFGEFSSLKIALDTETYYTYTDTPNYYGTTLLSRTIDKSITQCKILGVAKVPPSPPPRNPPPPPKPPKKKCCMSCCTPKENPNNDRLLRLILQKVTKLEKVTGDPISPVKTVFDGFDRIIKFLGIKEMPARFPKRLIYPNGKGQVELTNLLEILGYQVKQLDRAVGNLPRKIKVTDTNPAQAGNQSIEIEVHSLADMGAETLKYLIDTEGDGDATNNMLVRALYELGFIHQGVVQSSAMLDALVEWADFKQKYKKVKVPFAFDPYAGQKGKVGQGFDKQKNNAGKGATTEEEVEDLLPKLLQNTDVEIRILVNGEPKSVNDLLMDIKRDTAAAAAGVSEKASPERLEQLVAASQLVLKLQSAITRNNGRTALTAGYLKTKPKKKS